MYFHVFSSQGVRAQCWEATALFRLVEEIPLEFSTASGMHMFAQRVPVIPLPSLSLTLHNRGKCGSEQTSQKGTRFQGRNGKTLKYHWDEDRLLDCSSETEIH